MAICDEVLHLFHMYLQLLAASLSSLLSGLDVHEDIFSMGQLSSQVANQLGGMAETQARRKVRHLAPYVHCLSNTLTHCNQVLLARGSVVVGTSDSSDTLPQNPCNCAFHSIPHYYIAQCVDADAKNVTICSAVRLTYIPLLTPTYLYLPGHVCCMLVFLLEQLCAFAMYNCI